MICAAIFFGGTVPVAGLVPVALAANSAGVGAFVGAFGGAFVVATTFGLIGAATFVGSIVPIGGLVPVVLAAASPDVGAFGFIGATTVPVV